MLRSTSLVSQRVFAGMQRQVGGVTSLNSKSLPQTLFSPASSAHLPGDTAPTKDTASVLVHSRCSQTTRYGGPACAQSSFQSSSSLGLSKSAAGGGALGGFRRRHVALATARSWLPILHNLKCSLTQPSSTTDAHPEPQAFHASRSSSNSPPSKVSLTEQDVFLVNNQSSNGLPAAARIALTQVSFVPSHTPVQYARSGIAKMKSSSGAQIAPSSDESWPFNFASITALFSAVHLLFHSAGDIEASFFIWAAMRWAAASTVSPL
mmetsp:Transcript_126414/g.404756  ORF Transcript_126414/g.404756 Transcript_126414/m.404756 type:complete len:264 (-) Transcript_126414:405-1196(-)